MSKRETYETKTEELLQPIVEKHQVEVYDVEFVKEAGEWYLRVYIDKPDGVNIDDCVSVSRALSDELDKEDYIEESYTLEVSSPGLGRQLKKDKHFEKSLGETVVLKTYKAIDKCKEFEGVLVSFTTDEIELEINGEMKKFARTDVAAVHLALDF